MEKDGQAAKNQDQGNAQLATRGHEATTPTLQCSGLPGQQRRNNTGPDRRSRTGIANGKNEAKRKKQRQQQWRNKRNCPGFGAPFAIITEAQKIGHVIEGAQANADKG